MKWHKQLSFSVLCLSAVLAFSCTRAKLPDSPEGTLQRYVTEAFQVKGLGDKEKLIELSTGEALDYLQAMTEADFKKQFVESNLKLVSVQTKDLRQDNEGGVSLVYELMYKDGKVESPTVHTNKKIAYLVRNEKGEWKIRSTKNVKSFIEKKEDLVITPETEIKEAAPSK